MTKDEWLTEIIYQLHFGHDELEFEYLGHLFRYEMRETDGTFFLCVIDYVCIADYVSDHRIIYKRAIIGEGKIPYETAFESVHLKLFFGYSFKELFYEKDISFGLF